MSNALQGQLILSIHLHNNVLLQGIFVSALVQYLQIWVIEKRGPVFLAMGQPISLFITFVISWTFLGEIVHFGRYIFFLLAIHMYLSIYLSSYFSLIAYT